LEGEKRGRGEDGREGVRPFALGLADWLCLFASKHTQYSTSIQKNNRGRLPERHEYLSMLAAFTTKSYNTDA